MNLSYDLLLGYEMACADTTGRIYPMNHISIDVEGGVGFLCHVVADGDPPIVLRNGHAVRMMEFPYPLFLVDGLEPPGVNDE